MASLNYRSALSLLHKSLLLADARCCVQKHSRLCSGTSSGSKTQSSSSTASGPLSNIRVLDLSRVLAGPYCTMILGDLGAEIIKIEHPEGGDDTRGWGPPFLESGDSKESCYFLSINRNKKSVCVNLKEERGQFVMTSPLHDPSTPFHVNDVISKFPFLFYI